jgi:predicted Fe-S protein YdhL (DUF1289 family)
MMRVFQMIATDKNHEYFESALIDGAYHVAVQYAGPRTLCGIQLDGEDGVADGEVIEGKVTCRGCFLLIEEIKAMLENRDDEHNDISHNLNRLAPRRLAAVAEKRRDRQAYSSAGRPAGGCDGGLVFQDSVSVNG